MSCGGLGWSESGALNAVERKGCIRRVAVESRGAATTRPDTQRVRGTVIK
jgi:hypothetical protein